MALFAPVASRVILPPGPGAAASSNESSWPVLLTFMAVHHNGATKQPAWITELMEGYWHA